MCPVGQRFSQIKANAHSIEEYDEAARITYAHVSECAPCRVSLTRDRGASPRDTAVYRWRR